MLIMGCAVQHHPQKEDGTSITPLPDRVADYINARNEGNLTAEYKFFSPTYREAVSLEQFIKSRNVKRVKTTLRDIEYGTEKTVAYVQLSTDFFQQDYNLNGVRTKQTWRLIGSEWYIDAKPASLRDIFTPRKPHSTGKSNEN